jgi:hypothetical protein
MNVRVSFILTPPKCWDFVQNVRTIYMDMRIVYMISKMEDVLSATGMGKVQNSSKVLKMKKVQIALYKAVDEILWKDWDPIGINHIAPRDEYQSYVPEIFSMLTENKDVNEIADRLSQIATERMGLLEDKDLCLEVAEKLKKEKMMHHNNV